MNFGVIRIPAALVLVVLLSAPDAYSASRCQRVLLGLAGVMGAGAIAAWVVASGSAELDGSRLGPVLRTGIPVEEPDREASELAAAQEGDPNSLGGRVDAAGEGEWNPRVLPYEASMRTSRFWVHEEGVWPQDAHAAHWDLQEALNWLVNPALEDLDLSTLHKEGQLARGAIERAVYRGAYDRQSAFYALRDFDSRGVFENDVATILLLGRLAPGDAANYVRERAEGFLISYAQGNADRAAWYLRQLRSIEMRYPSLDRQPSRELLEDIVLGDWVIGADPTGQSRLDPYLFFYTDTEGDRAGLEHLRLRFANPVESDDEQSSGYPQNWEEALALRDALSYLDQPRDKRALYRDLRLFTLDLDPVLVVPFNLGNLSRYRRPPSEPAAPEEIETATLDELLDLLEGMSVGQTQTGRPDPTVFMVIYRISQILRWEILDPGYVTDPQITRLIGLMAENEVLTLEEVLVDLLIARYGRQPPVSVRSGLESIAPAFSLNSPCTIYLMSLAYYDLQEPLVWSQVSEMLLPTVRRVTMDQWGFFDPVYEVMVNQLVWSMESAVEGGLFPAEEFREAVILITRTPWRRPLLLKAMRDVLEEVEVPGEDGPGVPDAYSAFDAFEAFVGVAYNYGSPLFLNRPLTQREREEARWILDRLLEPAGLLGEFPGDFEVPWNLEEGLQLLRDRLELEGLSTPEAHRIHAKIDGLVDSFSVEESDR